MYVWSFASFLPGVLWFVGLAEGWWTVAGSGIFGAFERRFSLEKFLGSPSGLLVVLGFGVSLVMSSYYYAKTSVKMGSWWWF
jgi:hypothetical protein